MSITSVNLLAFPLYGALAASHRVRLSQFRLGLADAGITMQIQSLLDDSYLQRRFTGSLPSSKALLAAYGRRLQALSKAKQFDLAIIYAELMPLLPAWLEQRLLNRPYIFDLDDAFFLKYRSGRLRWLRPLLGCKTDQLLRGAAAVTAGNTYLAAYARRFNANVTLLPSVVDTVHYRPAEPQPAATPFTVGWIGSPTTAPFLQALVQPLAQLAREQVVRFVVVGGSAPTIAGVQVIELPWSLEREVALIQSFDVGVMPLPDTPWTRGKCAYKLIQCMACAIPVIASPVGANVEAVPTSCGLLADSADDWLASLRSLAADAGLRRRMGQAGREWVEQRYSLRTATPLLTEVIRSVARQR